MTAKLGNPDAKPFGLRRLWLTPYTDTDGSILSDTSYRLPIARTLAFTESEDFVTLDGDDKSNVAIAGKGATVDGSLEAGGLDLMCWSIVTGGELIEDGTPGTPGYTRIVRKRGTDQRGYFRVDGQVLSNGGGDTVARIYRCKANGKIQADMKFGAFMIPQIDFQGTPMPGDDDDYLYEIQFHDTKVTLGSTPAPNPMPIPSNLTVGTITGGSTPSVVLAWADIPTAASYLVQQSDDNGTTWTPVTSVNGGEPTDPTTVIKGLVLAKTYLFRAAAVFAGDITGDYCSSVSVTMPLT